MIQECIGIVVDFKIKNSQNSMVTSKQVGATGVKRGLGKVLVAQKAYREVSVVVKSNSRCSYPQICRNPQIDRPTWDRSVQE